MRHARAMFVPSVEQQDSAFRHGRFSLPAAISVLMGGCLIAFHDQRWPWLLLAAFLFIRMALNAVDGMLAREHGMKSKLGAILNELGDVVSDAALYLPFALLAGAYGWLVV